MRHGLPRRANSESIGRRRRWWPTVLGVLASVVVLTGCLGPTQADPTGTAPFGSLEVAVAQGSGIRVSGWVADPDTADPIVVKVGSEGRVHDVRADLSRPDVAAAHPGLGAQHGFDHVVTDLGVGRHGICVWAENVGRGSESRLLGCRTIDVTGGADPTGSLDTVVSPGPGAVRATGRAVDTDSVAPVAVAISIDARFVARTTTAPDHGYGLDFPATPGAHTVCAVALNVGWGQDRLIGCGRVDLAAPPIDHRPSGAVTSVVPVSGGVHLSGTATDPDGTVGLAARVAVQGGPTTVVPVVAGAFASVISGRPAGPVRICVTLLDVAAPAGAGGTSGDRALPCSTAVVGAVAVGTSGSPSTSRAVGPDAGNPLAGIDRDAGVSVTLRDGSVLWLFGDSSTVDANGNLRSFVSNTAAWAAPGSLAVTRDGSAAGAPVPFATPTAEFPACPADHPARAMWPVSAVARPDGVTGRDVVTAFMADVCLGGPLEILPVGIATVEWTYDPAAPPAGRPVVGTVVRQVLFAAGEPEFGTAAVTGPDDVVYAYDCDGPTGPETHWPDEYGPCTVARVPAASVSDRTAWRAWNGTGWVPDLTAAAPMHLPDGVDGVAFPVASLSVTRDPVHGVYVMAYSPWPGFVDRIFVRVATSPVGPWTAPVEVLLPGCNDVVGGVGYYCYAGTAQPAMSAPGLLGLGYYDQRIAVGPSGGQYLTVQVPFSVVLS